MSEAVWVALIGGGATVLAAIIAVLAKAVGSKGRPPEPTMLPPMTAMTLTGRYVGENGDLWDLCATLEVLGSRVKGHMHWTLVECPPALPWAKYVGRFGYEFVEGAWDQECLSLTGFKVSEAAFLTTAHYTLVFDSGRRAFEGTARATSHAEYKKWGGAKIRGMVTPSA